jgi:hypothetical protein
MGPDDFSRPQPHPHQPRQQHPPQRPMQDFGPRRAPQQPLGPVSQHHRPQRPVSDFAPRPHAPQHPHRPAHNLAPQPMPRPAADLSPPRPAHQHAQHHPTAQGLRPQHNQPTPQHHFSVEDDLLPVARQEVPKSVKEKRKISLLDKLLIVIGVAALLAFAGFSLASHKSGSSKTAAKGPSKAPLVQPEFTTYFPQPMPTGLSVSKGTITYSKNSFTFIIKQDGQNRLFVYEQPDSTDPGFSSLKSTLAAPKSITLSTGTGISGGLNTGTATAVKTDKNTNILVNYTNSTDDNLSKQVLSSMKETSDLASLKASDL